jgi:hypothetical protein
MTPRYQNIRQQVEQLSPEEQLCLLQELATLLYERSSVPHQSTSDLSLTGTVLRYDAPFEPVVDPNDWDALQ